MRILRKVQGVEATWKSLTRNDIPDGKDGQDLHKYAEAMKTLASKSWIRSGIKWIVSKIKEFYFEQHAVDKDGLEPGTILENIVRREERLQRHMEQSLDLITHTSSKDLNSPCLEGRAYSDLKNRIDFHKTSASFLRELELARSQMISNCISLNKAFKRPLRLLDIGSCYNPFNRLNEDLNNLFEVTALDLCPADDTVLRCDFLDVEIGPEGSEPVISVDPNVKSGQKVLHRLPRCSFDIITICLVLSYLPDSFQRGKIILKATELLKRPPEGAALLFILTPHSINKRVRDPIESSEAKSVRHCDYSGTGNKKTPSFLRQWQEGFERIGLRRWKHDVLDTLHGLVYFRSRFESAKSDDTVLSLPIAHDFREEKIRDFNPPCHI